MHKLEGVASGLPIIFQEDSGDCYLTSGYGRGLRDVSDFTDYFIVLTVESSRQMDSLRDDLESVAEENGGKLHHREGTSNGGWVLLDFIDVIVHLFNPDSRDYYQIEQAWPDAIETVRIQ